jgi:hypothetical protein
MGAICVRLRSNLMLGSNVSGNFTQNHVPIPLVALSMMNNDIDNATHFRDPFSLLLTLFIFFKKQTFFL